MMGTKEIAKQMADETTLNPKEAEMAIVQLSKIAKRLLTQGYTLNLEDLGSLRLTASSTGSETAEAVNAKNIKGLNIRFAPTKAFKEEINRAELKKALR
jgi:predicted histone-like DNA-binding protein